MKMNVIRPVLPDGSELTATATVVHAGKSLAIAEHRDRHRRRHAVALVTGTTSLGKAAELRMVDAPAALAYDIT